MRFWRADANRCSTDLIPVVLFDPAAVAVCGASETHRGCLATAHEASILALAISSDAKWLATESKDNTVKVWELAQVAWLRQCSE
jgi:WD40 repeat protein